MSNTIFTLDARNNVFLESMTTSLSLDDEEVFNAINSQFDICLSGLKQLNIDYIDLKNALIPRSQRNEIAFVFDSNKIGSHVYGFEIMEKMISLFDKESCNSLLVGDFIGSPKYAQELRATFFKYLHIAKNVDYINHDQFYIIYLNNLSDKSAKRLKEGLSDYAAYVGYFDLEHSSSLKSYLSNILIRLFIKCKMIIIAPTEETGDQNVYGYPFEQYGFIFKGIDSLSFGLFLSYKIEREVLDASEMDAKFSINAITKSVFSISDFELVIEDSKLAYLMKEKTDSIERAGMMDLTLGEFQQKIKEKINSNYFYNLCYIKEYQVFKFNILIETKRKDIDIPMKLTVALEYIPTEKILRLITMF